jgi:hypothetical protein
MALYSASQLIGKTIFLTKSVNYYSVSDINNFGDNAKPIGRMVKGQQFVIDSYLSPTDGYTSIYGITYAKRTYPYFTFFNGSAYDAIAVIGDGRFSTDALAQQGTLTVKEEVRKKELSEMSDFERFFANTFGSLSKPVKTIIIIAVIILLLYLLIPLIKKLKEK